MSGAAPALAALSHAVLQLHRGSREWPAASFTARACELLGSVIAFDACLWGSVAADAPEGSPPALHSLHTQGLSEAALALCLAGSGEPPALEATQIEPLAARRVILQLWRHPGAPAPLAADALADDRADQQALQFLMPHLVEAQRENRLSRAHAGDELAPARRSHALCDADGLLQQVDEQGLALLRTEWPRWCAARLPEPLAEAVAFAMVAPGDGAPAPTPPAPPFHGRQITVLMTRSDGLLLLDVRRRAAVDRLSTRQRDIALLYAEGHTGPQIARQFGLSPSTVNNHLGVIFKKLAVSNKVQLLNAMRGRAAV
jgi:two-component system uhpT operon response regulator UhpA